MHYGGQNERTGLARSSLVRVVLQLALARRRWRSAGALHRRRGGRIARRERLLDRLVDLRLLPLAPASGLLRIAHLVAVDPRADQMVCVPASCASGRWCVVVARSIAGCGSRNRHTEARGIARRCTCCADSARSRCGWPLLATGLRGAPSARSHPRHPAPPTFSCDRATPALVEEEVQVTQERQQGQQGNQQQPRPNEQQQQQQEREQQGGQQGQPSQQPQRPNEEKR
jgi:hypothetical protein